MQTTTAAQRGRILAYQSTGQGSVAVADRVLAFDVARHWRSPTAPVVNAVVDAAFDDAAEIASLTLVPAQQIAQEEAARAARLARAKGNELWVNARRVLGGKVLAALGLLLAGAFFLDCVGMQTLGSVSTTYWQLLGVSTDRLVQSGAVDGGPTLARIGFLLALAACAATMFTAHPKAPLGKCLPLLFVAVHALVLTMKIRSAIGNAGAAAQSFGGAEMARFAQQMAADMMAQLWRNTSLGAGMYAVVAAALALAAFGWLEYRGRRFN